MKNILLTQAMEAAGGTGRVAKSLKLTHEAVRKWVVNKLPRTEWTGETDYLSQIENLQIKRHGKVLVSAEQIKAAQVWE